MNEQRAQLNYLNIAPRKVRLISNTLKGLSVAEAEAQLLHRSQRASEKLLKLLRSAVANAKANTKLNLDKLVVAQFIVNPAPVLKRSLPRSMGRATSIFKRMSHVTVILKESDKLLAPRFVIAKPEEKKSKVKPAQRRSQRKPNENKVETEKQSKKEPGAAEPEKDSEVKKKKVRTPGTLRRFFQRRTGQ